MAYEKTMLNLIMCYQRIHQMRSAIGRSRKSVVSTQHKRCRFYWIWCKFGK